MKDKIYNYFCEANFKIDEPEKELLLCVLLRAVMDYQNFFESKPTQTALGRIHTSLAGWFRDWKSGNGEYFSFFDCCYGISEKPDDLRQIVLKALANDINFHGRGHHQKYKKSAIS